MTTVQDAAPKAKVFRERIGDTEYELREEKLDVFDDVCLWNDNPRLLPHLAESGVQSEEELENHLKQTPGYAALAKSIAEIGQMEAIYAWKRDDQKKYLVIEGATRVAILRDLARKHLNKPDEQKHRIVRAKILRPEFSLEERAVLLAKIHVRGTGVRSWGRFVEAQFIHETVIGKDGDKPIMSVSDLARHMGKSASWVSRLKDAYQFAKKFVDHLDSPDAERLALEKFSTLEEIAKCRDIGPKLKDYDNQNHDGLREEVFEMVRKNVFKEYRDARFMREFHDDPEKWAMLKQGEEHIANRLASDLRAGNSSIRGRLDALPGQLERAIERDPTAVNEDDVDHLKRALKVAQSAVNPGVDALRLELLSFTKTLENASLTDIRAIQQDDVELFEVALDDFRTRLNKHKAWN